MKYKTILMIATLFILSGCISMIGNARNKPVNIDTYHDINTAAKDIPAILELQKDSFENININKDVSPKINREGRVEYLEMVQLKGKKDDRFSIVISSLCDCLGFRKWAVLADPFMFSPEGTPINLKKEGTLITQNITGTFPQDGTYKLMIIANTKYLDQKMGSINGYWDYSNSASGFSLPLTVYPTGVVQVEWGE